MGDEVIITQVVAENWGTLIQIDFEVNNKKDRMFLPIRDVFKALNNYLQENSVKEEIKMGAVLEDPENYVNPNLIT
jgi:hypothetical protein